MDHVNPGAEKYERLLEEYYDLARERAALEVEMDEENAGDETRYGEVAAEMAALEVDLAELLESFDETDFESLFEEVGE